MKPLTGLGREWGTQGEMVVNVTQGRWVSSEDRFYSHWTSWTKTPVHWFRFLCAVKCRPTLLVWGQLCWCEATTIEFCLGRWFWSILDFYIYMFSCGKIFVLAKIVTFHVILFTRTVQNKVCIIFYVVLHLYTFLLWNSVHPSPQTLNKMFAAILPILSLEGK